MRGCGVARDDGFDEFVIGASSRLLRAAYLLVGERAAAEDLLQDVLEKMFVAWPRIDEPTAYARRALAHGATNRWRRRSRKPEVPLDGHDRAAPTADPTVRRDVIAALATLPRGQRAVIVLRYFEDLTTEQTAAALGCSVGTVKSQTARALPRLRDLLALTQEAC
ncbi:MAG: subfamily polymerase sigma-24 factor [Frankiales bacterium]|nr:subfamily polymerase sigma-24 factor [Frankiales bacterium]